MRRLAFWAVLTLLLAGCGASSTPSAATPPPAAPGAALEEDFEFTLYQGQEILGGGSGEFSQLFGQGKPVILNFWAGLCPPCRAEMPAFQSVWEAHQEDLIIFGLDVGPYTGLGSQEDGRALLEELGVSYPAGFTPDATVVRRYEIQGMPTTVFLDPSGKRVAKHTGLLTEGQLLQQVGALLDE